MLSPETLDNRYQPLLVEEEKVKEEVKEEKPVEEYKVEPKIKKEKRAEHHKEVKKAKRKHTESDYNSDYEAP